MVISGVPAPVLQKLKQTTSEFIVAMKQRDFDKIWNKLITLESVKLLASAAFPIWLFEQGKIDALLQTEPSDPSLSIAENIGFEFQADVIRIRTLFFEKIAEGLEESGWYQWSGTDCFADQDGSAAVFVADATTTSLFLIFVRQSDGGYRVDFLALCLFLTVIKSSALFRIGERALELGKQGIAITYFELAGGLSAPYKRLRMLGWEHQILRHMIAIDWVAKLQEDSKYTELAREQVKTLVTAHQQIAPQFLGNSLLVSIFNRYSEISRIELDKSEIAVLHNMDDKPLREAIASVLLGVDVGVAQREARKPDTSAEITDMELPVQLNNSMYYLCIPIKSGREIRTKQVPVSVMYQILRPIVHFSRRIVIFATAKPCSQPLHNEIKGLRDKYGWVIEVIEHIELAKLLKINGLLKS